MVGAATARSGADVRISEGRISNQTIFDLKKVNTYTEQESARK
jgi:hypothetical protein